MTISRRDFLGRSARASAALAAAGGLPGMGFGSAWGGSGPEVGLNPLRMAPETAANGLTLVAAEGAADLGGGARSPAWMLNQSLPSPLIRLRRGERFRVTMQNQLKDELILHWHGLTPPEAGDGHPRLAVHKGDQYGYDFTVDNRAGTYWYHSHAHMKTAKHTYLGIGGLLLVSDDEEEALGLPSGAREVPVILQDRKLDGRGVLAYADPNGMAGQMGDQPVANGTHRAYLEVDTALYRFRVLNGSNARIFRLERSDGEPLVVIGNDGGLIGAPLALPYVDVAPAERLDLLMDFSGAREGQTVMLRSAPFKMPGGMEHMGVDLQGTAMDLLELRVAREVREPAVIPSSLCHVEGPDPAGAVRERRFRFTSFRDPMSRSMMMHQINGKTFHDMEEIHQRVPFGETEIWSFVNDNGFAHPVHLHGTHFRVVERLGGRGRVMPWETGLKDTVLIHPEETVKVAVRFTAHRGLFPLHCHNLEHEDAGMMANILVE